jgi:hypothetical protein
MVVKSSILVGAEAETLSQQLLNEHLISNWQKLAPMMVNTTRILLIVNGGDQDYNDALNAVIAAAANLRVAWQHDDYTTYGDPNYNTWMPPLSADPNYVQSAAQPA